jgi:hypothetical protein
MAKTEYELILIKVGFMAFLLITYANTIARNRRHGMSGGYTLKLSVNLPCSNRRNALWKPQIGQSIPNKVLNAQGRRWWFSHVIMKPQ